MRLVMPWLFGFSMGCGLVRSNETIMRAQSEIAAAKTAGAETAAPFELASAQIYLDKAREKQGRSDLIVATELSGKALDCARLARLMAEKTSLHPEETAEAEQFAAVVRCRPGPLREGLPAHLEPAARAPKPLEDNPGPSAELSDTPEPSPEVSPFPPLDSLPAPENELPEGELPAGDAAEDELIQEPE